MTWISRIKEQISSLGHTSAPQPLGRHETGDEVTEQFRQAMLGLLPIEPSERSDRLRLRIGCAATLQSLWFMRSDMMALLASTCGESEALHRLEAISSPVREALPSGLRSRPSPLAHRD